jgi:NDP-hexose-3-ketoreductase
MKKIRIAILGASEIAFRRFLPAIKKDNRFEYVGVAYYRDQDIEKAKSFQNLYGGEVFVGFDKVINNSGIDAIYVPQPPALHYQYGKNVLDSGKCLFMEKPFTNSLSKTRELIKEAKEKNVASIENYMFRFHKQIPAFIRIANSGRIGTIDHYEVRFAFPLRQQNDFRYIKVLGGGALLDCGGYTIMLSNILVGGDGLLVPDKAIFKKGYEVDMGGSGSIISLSSGLRCLFSFGMDDEYACYAKAFGSKGVLVAPRVLTAPCDFDVKFQLFDQNELALQEEMEIGSDDSFLKSINNFYEAFTLDDKRDENYCKILKQAEFIEQMQVFGGLK